MSQPCELCDKGVFVMQDADGDYIHGVNFHTSEKTLCKRQSLIGIRHWICTSCQPDYEYKANAHEKNFGSPFVLYRNMNSGTYGLQVCDCECHRDVIGGLVRNAWIDWAKEHPQPKPSWLVPYEQLCESDKEADRVIGSRLMAVFLRWIRTNLEGPR